MAYFPRNSGNFATYREYPRESSEPGIESPDDYTDDLIPTGDKLNNLYNTSIEENAGYYFEELIGHLSSLMLFIYLCNKFVVKKDFTLSSKETMFVVLMILKLQFPAIGIIIFATQIPTTISIIGQWFKKNTNKRSELEAELRLISQV